jgi:glycerate kinase
LPRLVLCAPAAFKETLSAADAAHAMAAGAEAAGFSADRCPVADGGDGSLQVLAEAWGARLEPVVVSGPLGEPVTAAIARSRGGRLAVVELATASGLALVEPRRRDPGRATTHGTGQLIAEALRRGAEEVIVCLGGSATMDGGAGMVQALGGRFYDHGGRLIEEPLCGSRLGAIARYEPPSPMPRLRAACDVDNPLLGRDGAAVVYAPQKGAAPQQVLELAAALSHLASICGGDPSAPGSGSAGGAGYGLAAMLGAELVPGIDLVLDAVGFARRAGASAIVLTGEGRLDEQSPRGKAAVGVARAAAAAGRPAAAIVGQYVPGAMPEPLFESIVSLERRFGLARALAEPAALLEQAARDLLRGRARPGP